ncbi:MAG: LD-carboxypeptidase [Clostridioides sp.]|jgi:muramoyltetrapeptide carboxypeptidase|nr:LD-carboxypeptidase [Clostridioides sp.]
MKGKLFMIGVIAPSSGLVSSDINSDIEKIGYSLEQKLGKRVKFSKGCYSRYNDFLSADDYTRCADLEEMFLDDEVDLIICLRGGYGSARILNMIDYEIIKNNPKIFIGFSDITALNIAFNQRCGLKTFHGPMASSSKNWDKFTLDSLKKAIDFVCGYEYFSESKDVKYFCKNLVYSKDENKNYIYENKNYEDENKNLKYKKQNFQKKNDRNLILKNPKCEKIYTLKSGVASGEIVGGNLSVIVSLLGTDFEIDTRNKILLLEDVSEPLYKIDRMMNQLKMARKLDRCSGIIFGDFADSVEKSEEYKLIQLFNEYVDYSGKPAIYNLQTGHCSPMITLPLGQKVTLKFDKKFAIIKD